VRRVAPNDVMPTAGGQHESVNPQDQSVDDIGTESLRTNSAASLAKLEEIRDRLEFALKNGASLRTACDLLNERGIASTGGGRWHAPSLLNAAKRLGLR
jgi:hypothetical protein